MGYRYIGSKLRIADDIISYFDAPAESDGYFIDAFSGTGIVVSKAADLGWKIKINDMMQYASAVSAAQLIAESDLPFEHFDGYENILCILNKTDKKEFVWQEYSPAAIALVELKGNISLSKILKN